MQAKITNRVNSLAQFPDWLKNIEIKAIMFPKAQGFLPPYHEMWSWNMMGDGKQANSDDLHVDSDDKQADFGYLQVCPDAAHCSKH